MINILYDKCHDEYVITYFKNITEMLCDVEIQYKWNHCYDKYNKNYNSNDYNSNNIMDNIQIADLQQNPTQFYGKYKLINNKF